jgi:hypothetical protein
MAYEEGNTLKVNILLFSILISVLFCKVGFAEPEQTLQAAFIRGDDLWLKKDNLEMQLSKNQKVSGPKWSFDGKFIAYSIGEQQHEIWVYSLEKNKHFRIYHDAENYQWSPNKNQLAFKIDEVLNITTVSRDNVEAFKNVSTGVSNYSWLPDGSGFLVSTRSQLLPTGWTNVELFLVPADANMDRNKIKHFYTLPPESPGFFAIGTSIFKWSNDNKWISFTANPTASLSADSNTLCILSSDAKRFQRLDIMLHYQEWFQWAPRKDSLAYIAGEGRVAIQNKHLKVKDFPALKSPSYTPHGFVDRDFTWENDRFITVSRSKESKDPAQRPLPALYHVNIQNQAQEQMTNPPEKSGDFGPYFLKQNNKLTWIRSDGEHADVWNSNPDGSHARVFIKNIHAGSAYYDWRSWSSVIAWYDPHNVQTVSALDGAEVFDIQKGDVVKTIKNTASLQREVEKWLSSIVGHVGSLKIEPDNGIAIKIELAPPLKVNNQWLIGTVTEVVLFVSQSDTYYPTLLIFTKEKNVIAIHIHHDLKTFLNANNLYNPKLNLNRLPLR